MLRWSKKVFDRIKLFEVIDILQKGRATKQVKNFIKDIYTNFKTQIQTWYQVTAEINCNS